MERVAYISADFGVPIFGTKGCSIHAQGVIAAMLRRGAVLDVFSPSTQGEPHDGLRAARLHPLPKPGKVEPVAREKAGLQLNEVLAAELNRIEGFDLVYERYSLWSFAGMEYARERRIPGVLEVNAPLIDEQQRYRVLVDREAAESAARRAFKAATQVLAVSREVASWLKAFGVAPEKIHIFCNAIDPTRFPEKIAPKEHGPNVFTVGFVGTLKSWHGVDVLVEAFARLRAADAAVRLLIVGDGPERETLNGRVAKLKIQDAVEFLGSVDPAEVPAWIASMDVAVAPYPALDHFYFSPLKVFEYMAAGRAVVASEIGQLTEIIEPEVTGVLVPAGDAEALAGALLRLKENPQLRRQLGSAARAEVLQDHTWDQVVERIFRLASGDGFVTMQTPVLT